MNSLHYTKLLRCTIDIFALSFKKSWRFSFFLDKMGDSAGRSSNWSHLALISSFKTQFFSSAVSTQRTLSTNVRFNVMQYIYKEVRPSQPNKV